MEWRIESYIMIYLILGIFILGVITATIHYFGNRRRQRRSKIAVNDEAATTAAAEAGSECCGQHEVCERDSLLAAVSKKVEYYDDEELDTYRGTASGEYGENAIEEFREVLYTMQEIEVAGWLRSLQLRNINLPDQLKDEAFLIVEERRNN